MPKGQSIKQVRVKPPELETWYEQYFAQGMTVTAIAAQANRQYKTVYKHLHTAQAAAAKERFQKAVIDRINRRLLALGEEAVDSWAAAMRAVTTGDRTKHSDHKPAKDLLQTIKAVDIPVPQQDRSTQILIQIGGGSIRDLQHEIVEATAVSASVVAPRSLPAPSEASHGDDD